MKAPTTFEVPTIQSELPKALTTRREAIAAQITELAKAWATLEDERQALRAKPVGEFKASNLQRLRDIDGELFELARKELAVRVEAETWLAGDYSKALAQIHGQAHAKIQECQGKVMSQMTAAGFDQSKAKAFAEAHPSVVHAKAHAESLDDDLNKVINPQLPVSPLFKNAQRCQEITAALQRAIAQADQFAAGNV